MGKKENKTTVRSSQCAWINFPATNPKLGIPLHSGWTDKELPGWPHSFCIAGIYSCLCFNFVDGCMRHYLQRLECICTEPLSPPHPELAGTSLYKSQVCVPKSLIFSLSGCFCRTKYLNIKQIELVGTLCVYSPHMRSFQWGSWGGMLRFCTLGWVPRKR